MEREKLRILTQLVTGHANLKRHRYLLGLEDNPDCNLCGEVQTSIHILTDCPELAGPRTAILGKPIFNINDIRSLSIGKVMKFARKTGFWNTGNQ